VRLYRGDLLEGWYCDWCLVERERLQNQLLDALEKLSGFYEAQRDSEQGLFYARQVLAVDPAREHVHRQIMQLHLCAGHRTEALKQYRVCERVLLRELSLKPSTDTRRVYESIRDDRQDDLADTALAPAPLACNVNQLAGLLDALERVKATLANIEMRLRFAAASMSSTDDRCPNTLERDTSTDVPETRLRRPAGTS
jgi:DNA-binding SARP family transcriptional activator